MKFYVKKKRTPQIIIVSLIDIFAMLLIFFIVTTTFKTAQSQLSINLPEAKSATQTQSAETPVTIYVTDKEELWLDKSKLKDADELAARLKDLEGKNPKLAVALSASKSASFGLMVKLLGAMKEAGIKNVPAFTQAKESK